MRRVLYFPPHAATEASNDEIYAIKALASGTASEGQQIKALDFIINKVSLYYDLSYREDGQGGDRATAFAEGKRYVGAQIVKFIKIVPKAKDSDPR